MGLFKLKIKKEKDVKRIPVSLIILFVFVVAGCATIKGATKEEQRESVLDMRDSTLERLYADFPRFDQRYLGAGIVA